MKSALIGISLLGLFAGAASAADPLGATQLDQVTAGLDSSILDGINCPGCTLSSSSSISNNGTTTTTSNTGVISPPGQPPAGGNGGAGNNNGGGNNNNPLPGQTVNAPPAVVAAVNLLLTPAVFN
jgi:hypothetical protein